MNVSHLSRSAKLLCPATPTTYTLELTSQCNNACEGCGNVFEKGIGFLSGAEWQRLLDNLSPHIYYLRISGGEPTLHPEFNEIVRHVDILNAPFAVFSNAQWDNPQKIVTLLGECSNLVGLLISLHGKNATSHNTFTNTNSFTRTVQNIRLATQCGLPVDTNTVLTRQNWQDVRDIVQLSRDLGARCAVFSRHYGITPPRIELAETELMLAVKEIEMLRDEGKPVKLNNGIPHCFCQSSSGGCLAGVTFCTIDPQGNVRPCNHAPLILGNLQQKSIAEIWCSQAAQEWREMIPTQCFACKELAHCRGGCKATAMQCGLERDPLIRKPIIKESNEQQNDLTVYAGLKPVPKFAIRQEKFGFILIHMKHVVPVDFEAMPIIEALDGQTNLAQIKEAFGPEAISLTIQLYQQGVIDLT